MSQITLVMGKGKVFNPVRGMMHYGIEDHAEEAVRVIRETILAEGPMLISQSAHHIVLTPQPVEMVSDNPVMRFRLKFNGTKLPKGIFKFIRPATDMRRLAVVGACIDAEGKFLDLIIGETKLPVRHKKDEADE